MIRFPKDRPGIAIVTFLDGQTEAFEEGNHRRLLKAIEDARIDYSSCLLASSKSNSSAVAYDGHVQSFGDPGLLHQLSLPVSDNMLPLLKGKKLGPPSPINSLARYALRKVGDDWHYDFVELRSAKEFDFEAMREAGLKAIEEHERAKRKKS